jgi:hypothetical protein
MTPRARTLGVLLDDLAHSQPGAEAVVSRDDRVTYAACARGSTTWPARCSRSA